MPNLTLSDDQHAFKIGDINWDYPIPSFSRVPGDSDTEHRLRSECYVAKAAWIHASAYSEWIERQKQMLQDMAAKGISDVPAYMRTWSACEADAKVLSIRVEEAKVKMDAAQKEIDMCVRGRSRAVLEFAIQELRDKIFSEDKIDPNELFILRNKLIDKQKILQEVLKDDEGEGSEDWDDKAEKAKNKGEDAYVLAYLKMDEEKKTSMEGMCTMRHHLPQSLRTEYKLPIEKARKAFWRYVNLSASKNPNQRQLKAAATQFSLSYRRTARTIWDFLPEAGTTCRDSSLLVLTTSTPNLFCRFHHLRHAYKAHDSVTKFRGIAYAKSVTSRGRGDTDRQVAKPNHMDCGCLIDNGLMEIFFWKTVTAHSTNPSLRSVTHNMGTGVLPCTIRAFWMAQFKSTTGLTIGDLYNLSTDESVRRTVLTAKMIMKHVYTIQHQLKIGVSLVFDTAEGKATFFGLLGHAEDGGSEDDE